MSKYFDKDFFKFFLGFVAIVSISLMFILATKLYERNSGKESANAIEAVTRN
jgi:hypothetical protein